MGRQKFFFATLIILFTFYECGQKTAGQNNEMKWSARMANTVMTQADSLIHYVSGKPKWAYDVAFLGMAIDKLGNTDRR